MKGDFVFGGKKYISSQRASVLSGYNRDYIGQLCRKELLKSRIVGRSWYVEEDALNDYLKTTKEEKHKEGGSILSSRLNDITKECVKSISKLPMLIPSREVIRRSAIFLIILAIVSSFFFQPTSSLAKRGVEKAVTFLGDKTASLALTTHQNLSAVFEGIKSKTKNVSFGSIVVTKEKALSFGKEVKMGGKLAIGKISETKDKTISSFTSFAGFTKNKVSSFSKDLSSKSKLAVKEISKFGSSLASGFTNLFEGRQNKQKIDRVVLLDEKKEKGKAEEKFIDKSFQKGLSFVVRISERTSSSFSSSKERITLTKNSVKNIFSNIKDGVREGIQKVANFGKSKTLAFKEGIKNNLLILKTGSSSVVTLSKNAFRNSSSFTKDKIEKFSNGFVATSISSGNLASSFASRLFNVPSRLAKEVYCSVTKIWNKENYQTRCIDREKTFLVMETENSEQEKLREQIENIRLQLEGRNEQIKIVTQKNYPAYDYSGGVTTEQLNTRVAVLTQALLSEIQRVESKIGTGIKTERARTINTIGMMGRVQNLSDLNLSDKLTGIDAVFSSDVSATYFLATLATATSTFAGGLTVDTSDFVVDSSGGRVGIGTANPLERLDIRGRLHLSQTTAPNTVTDKIYNIAGDLFWNGNQLGLASSAGGWVDDGTSVRLATFSDNVGIGTSTPSYKLDVAGFINTDQYSGYKQAGNTILYASSTNYSTLAGIGAGNALLSDGLYNTALGYQALYTATSTDGNTAVGYRAGYDNTTGFANSFIGSYAGRSNTTGFSNSFIGYESGRSNTTGFANSFVGFQAGRSNTTGSSNSFIGVAAGYANTTANYNSFIGSYAGRYNTTGSYNSFIGRNAGLYIADGSTANTTGDYNIFIGQDTKALADNDQNEIVIGYDAIGVGSNSVVLGSTTILTTILRGNVGIGTTNPLAKLDVEGSILSSSKLVRTAPSTSNWVIFGDSISDSLTADYPAFVISELGLTGTITNAVGGDTISNQLGDLDTLLSGDPNYLDSFDILSLLIGVNDFATDKAIGTRADTVATATYAGYLKDFIETAFTANPNLEIYLMTPMEADSASVPYQGANSAGWTLRELSVLISQIASDYGVQVIDLYSLSQFNNQTLGTYTNDNLHPNTIGRDVIGKIISDAFSSSKSYGKPIDTSVPVLFSDNITILGNVGIGVAIPSAKLEVVDGSVQITHSSGAPTLKLSDGVASDYGIIDYDRGSNSVRFGQSEVSGVYAFYLNNSGNIGVGIASPSYKLDVAGFINTDQYSGYKQAGNTILYASSTNYSTLAGIGAGNSLLSDGLYNTALGYQALNVATSTDSNTAVGYQAGYSNMTGWRNSFVGYWAGYSNVTGTRNSFIGGGAGYSNTTGYRNSSLGYQSGFSNTTGDDNSFVGDRAGYLNTEGSDNSFIGVNAGRYIADGSTANTTGDYNIFIGRDTKALADNDQNEIVIGYDAIGVGSNSVVLGNSSILTTILRGNVGIGTTSPYAKLSVVGQVVASDFVATSTTSTHSLLLPMVNDASTPTLAFGDGDSGFYQSVDNKINVATGGANRWTFNGALFQSETNFGALLLANAGSSVIPSMTFRGDTNTGIGRATANALSIIAGATEVARATTTNGVYDQFIISPDGVQNLAGTPSLAFGDGDTGMYESVDDFLRWSIGGTNEFLMVTGAFKATETGGASMLNEVSSATNPVFSFTGDANTGIGRADADALSIIAGATEVARATTTNGVYDQFIISPDGVQNLAGTPSLAFGDGDSGFYESTDDVVRMSLAGFERFLFAGNLLSGTNAAAGAILNEASSATNPTLLPRWAYADTGIGSAGADALSLIAGATEVARATTTNGVYDQFIISPDGVQNIAGTPSLAFGDGDSGFFESGDDELVISIAGTPLYKFDSAGFFNANRGDGWRLKENNPSGTSPTYIFTSDEDTGIGSAGADILSLIAGGVNGLNIVETGGVARVGIGTSSPQTKLHVVDGLLRVTRNGTGAAIIVEREDGAAGNFVGALDSVVFGADSNYPIWFAHDNRSDILAGSFLSPSIRMIIDTNGRVGIGTTSPASTFTVVGSGCFSQGVGATVACSTTAGTVSAKAHATSEVDVAEFYDIEDQTIEAGDIVAIDPEMIEPAGVAKSGSVNGPIMGVVSTSPGILLGISNRDEYRRPIALAGRIPVKVTNENGAIKKGDYISASGAIYGVGKKANDNESIVGVALESYDNSDVGKIMVFVNLSWQRISSAVDGGDINTGGSTGKYWIFNENTGAVTAISPLDMNGLNITGIHSLQSENGTWSIDSDGKLITTEVQTHRLCVGDICINEDGLRQLLDLSGVGYESLNGESSSSGSGSGGGEEEPNDPPPTDPEETVLEAGFEFNIDELLVSFSDTSISNSASSTISSWEWNFGDDSQVSNEQNPSYQYPESGDYQVSLTVSDGGTESNTIVHTVSVTEIIVENQSPIADAGIDQIIEVETATSTVSVSLDGSGSSDSDGEVVSFQWVENGVELGIGLQINYEFGVGEHQIDLNIVDNNGAEATDNVVIKVTNN